MVGNHIEIISEDLMYYEHVSKIFIAGHSGLVGTYTKKIFTQNNNFKIITIDRKFLDLRNRFETFKYIKTIKPDLIINCAAEVGGMFANKSYPVRFSSDNLLIQTNLLDAAHTFEIENFINIGSSCIYPVKAPQPYIEDDLFEGSSDLSNIAFSQAKLAGISLLEAYNRQFNYNWISVIPSSLYGEFDDFLSSENHVIPATINKIIKAKNINSNIIKMFGDGSAMREFLHAQDLAEALFYLATNKLYKFKRLNVGSNEEISIKDLTVNLCKFLNYDGEVVWGSSEDNGIERKVLNSSKILSLGWMPKISLIDGLNEICLKRVRK